MSDNLAEILAFGFVLLMGTVLVFSIKSCAQGDNEYRLSRYRACIEKAQDIKDCDKL